MLLISFSEHMEGIPFSETIICADEERKTGNFYEAHHFLNDIGVKP